MTRITNDGVVKFHVSVHVTADEMQHWSPDLIRHFFNGIAIVEEAAKEGRKQAAAVEAAQERGE